MSSLEFVVKISKFCNLRCSYCYEFNELSNKQVISLVDLGRMFSTIRDHASTREIDSISFIWHGGEPFLIPIAYYEEIQKLQASILGDWRCENWTQTNLTVLTDRHLTFLTGGDFFSGIGVSFDVFGTHRVDQLGRNRNDIILKNIDKLLDYKISFAGISVLNVENACKARQIQVFWQELGVSFRLLPFHLSVSTQQSQEHSLRGGEIIEIYKQCFLDWLRSDVPINVSPINRYIKFALAYIGGVRTNKYVRDVDESVFIINVDGGVWGLGPGEVYPEELRYGNIFMEPFSRILESPNRRVCNELAEERVKRFCLACPYYGACPGAFVADATYEEELLLADVGCVARAVIDCIVNTIDQTNLSADLAKVFSDSGKASRYMTA